MLVLPHRPPPLPCSKNRLCKVGQALATETATQEDFDLYAAALDVYDQRTSMLRDVIDTVDWTAVLGRDVELHVTARTKTLGTLVEKLRRQPLINFPYIRDISGVRIVGDMHLSEQNRIGEHLLEVFGLPESAVIDRRAEPASGYRALHISVAWEGLSAEVQIRTELQAAWADIYERQADLWGREMRYGSPPAPGPDGTNDARVGLIAELHRVSLEQIAIVEELRDDVATMVAAAPGLDHELASLRKRRGPEAVKAQTQARAFRSKQNASAQDLEQRVEALVQSLRDGLLLLAGWAETVK